MLFIIELNFYWIYCGSSHIGSHLHWWYLNLTSSNLLLDDTINLFTIGEVVLTGEGEEATPLVTATMVTAEGDPLHIRGTGTGTDDISVKRRVDC